MDDRYTDEASGFERERVRRVTSLIDRRLAELSRQLGDVKEQVVEIRKHFWDDVTINLDHMDDVIETHTTLKQQAELLAERERTHMHAKRQYDKLRRLRLSPYFGRIDFREDGSDETLAVYLGIGSLVDEESGGEFLIYDWRAPISSLYYDYGPGPASYETPAGLIRGEMELKRQFVFRNGELQYWFDTGETIGDEILREVLGQGADATMKNIVATIQRDQNRMIRHDAGRMLIVSGPAGSGKTSAALQRVAYLLYKHRETLSADQVVLFSPNPLFNRYISTVLPELGEENMQQTTLQEYLEHRLSRVFRVESPFDQLEDVLTARDGDPAHEARQQGIRFKASADFLRLIEGYKRHLERQGLVFRALKLKGRTLVSAQAMSERFYGDTRTAKLAPRLDSLAEWLLEELRTEVTKLRDEPWVEEEAEMLSPEDMQKVYRRLEKELRQRKGAFNERLREAELMKELVLSRHLKRLQARVKRLRFLDLPATYRRLYEQPDEAAGWLAAGGAEAPELPERWKEICEQTAAALERGDLPYEDAMPYLYLQELIEGFRVNMRTRYVLVDEAQDYAPIHFAFLKKLFPRARMTVLGDPNQAIHAFSPGTGFEPLVGLYGPADTETIAFNRTYRSTLPIVRFTSAMLPDGDRIVPFNRDGELPMVKGAATSEQLHAMIAETLREWSRQGVSTIAVICKTLRESREAYAALSPLAGVPLRLITPDDAAFEPGVTILPSYLAKGIEFDAVIVYDASRDVYGKEDERKLLYTVCTRAMHRLHVYYKGEPSPLLPRREELLRS
ncbi:RNA polymerase recycling motor HelD [Paenibacillus thermoaerophilus]|uniref:RNA polymerase recycling motor HelD n=1 Tax=Paenibacillus thermoaerophilus TaxID=1215385 RepID=A0ABW2V2U7_9BACL|nr:RNA polymerase recycling motor HelD [Paenibacillus thermoaerophilus]TMV14341.1 helicase [Paenibacillus thermoaerophilus]